MRSRGLKDRKNKSKPSTCQTRFPERKKQIENMMQIITAEIMTENFPELIKNTHSPQFQEPQQIISRKINRNPRYIRRNCRMLKTKKES